MIKSSSRNSLENQRTVSLNYQSEKNVSTHFSVWSGKDTVATPAGFLDGSADCNAELTTRTLDAAASGNLLLLLLLFFCATRIDSTIAVFHSLAAFNSESGAYASNW